MTYRIKNWSSFQHFKDRRPPWVKLYRELLNDHGGISIVQECWPDEDAIVAFELEDAEVIAQAILDIYKEGWSC